MLLLLWQRERVARAADVGEVECDAGARDRLAHRAAQGGHLRLVGEVGDPLLAREALPARLRFQDGARLRRHAAALTWLGERAGQTQKEQHREEPVTPRP